MAKIQLSQRRELPPAQVGVVKPPDIPRIDTAATLAGFAGKFFEKLVETVATNEESKYQSDYALAIQKAQTAVADNPGASFEEYQNIQKDMLKEMDAAQKGMTTPRSRAFARNHATRNREVAKEKFQTEMEEIRTQRELVEFRTRSDEWVAAGNIAEFEKLVDGHTGTLLSQEAAEAFKATGLARMEKRQDAIDEAQIEAEKGQALGDAFAVWESTVTPQLPKGDLNEAFKAINKDPRILQEDKQEAESELKTRVTNRRAEAELAVEAQRESDRDAINKLFTERDYTAVTAAIEASTLDEREQGIRLREARSRADAAVKKTPEINDGVALDKITTAIAQVGNDTLSLADAKKIYNDNRGLLKTETADSLLKELNKEFDRSVDGADARVRTSVRSRAVGKSESALDRLIEASFGLKGDDKRTLEERITTAREKFNLELDNFNRWEESLRAWRRTNNTAAPEEIQKEGMRSWFTEYAGKDIELLRKETAEAIGKFNEPTRILMEKPNGEQRMVVEGDVDRAVSKGWKKL